MLAPQPTFLQYLQLNMNNNVCKRNCNKGVTFNSNFILQTCIYTMGFTFLHVDILVLFFFLFQNVSNYFCDIKIFGLSCYNNSFIKNSNPLLDGVAPPFTLCHLWNIPSLFGPNNGVKSSGSEWYLICLHEAIFNMWIF